MKRCPRPEPRHPVDFPVVLAWQDRQGLRRSTSVRCVDLSASGARVETKDKFEPHTMVLVQSEQFGRMGNASVRYCNRDGMKYNVGLHFLSPLGLSDPVRRAALERVLRGV